MNPSSHENPGLNLPAPVPEQGSQAVSGVGENQPGMSPESVPNNATPSAAEASGAAAQAFSAPLPLPPATASSDESTTTTSVVPLTTDKDLIDKEIVDKAKAIISKTKDDPYTQSEEITVFKADHLYKSYNRKLKTK